MRRKYRWITVVMALWTQYGLAMQAPFITDHDLVEELFVDPKGHLNLEINNHWVKAAYVEEPILRNWLLEGLGDTRRVAIDYIKNVYNHQSPVTPLSIDILNDRGLMIKVNKNNRGERAFFKGLEKVHEGMWAVKYRYQIPFLNSQEFEDKTGIYPCVNQTFFTVYAIVHEADIVFTEPGEKGDVALSPCEGGSSVTKATIEKDVPLVLPESLVEVLPSLTEDHAIKMYMNKIWLFNKGRAVTFFY